MKGKSSDRWWFGLVGLLVGWMVGAAMVTVALSPWRHPPELPVQHRLPPSQAVVTDRDIELGRRSSDSDVEGDRVVLRPTESARVLVYDDVDRALNALERFLGGLDPGRLSQRQSQSVRVGIVDLHWHIEGKGDDQTIRIVALPTDPYQSDYWPCRTIEALAAWGTINDIAPTSESRFSDEMEATTSVHTPHAPLRMKISEAAIEEFRSRGLTIAQEGVAMDCACFLARDEKGEVLWCVRWDVDDTWSVRHYADPFDTKGEQEVLLAIFRRATGLEPMIRLNAFR
jgi:hypothetical protein